MPEDQAVSREALEAELARLREAVQARDDFISIIAHELRNPMTPLLIQVQSLHRAARAAADVVPPRIVRDLARLDTIVANYLRRATTLLDISRLSSGAFVLEPQSVSLTELLQDLVQRAEPCLQRAGSVVEASLEPGIEGWVDPLAVEEVADNLLSNAVKYGAGKPVRLSLHRDGDCAWIEVRDQGIGISEADRQRIFERFERAVPREHSAGYGLGLWIVGRLVAAMRGELRVDSTPGRGSCFAVTLPLHQNKETRHE